MPLDNEARRRGAATKVERSRQSAIGASAKLMKENGIFSVELRDVVEQSGVSAPTIYRLFGSKASLFAQAHEVLQAQNTEASDPIEYHI